MLVSVKEDVILLIQYKSIDFGNLQSLRTNLHTVLITVIQATHKTGINLNSMYLEILLWLCLFTF